MIKAIAGGVISLLSGVILAGGAHRGTNGKNRAFLTIGGETLLERQIREMRTCCDEITIVTGEPDLLRRSVDRDVRIISDYFGGEGLLSGFHAGIALSGNEEVWVLGCHMPFPSSQAAMLLYSRMMQGGGLAAIPFIRGAAIPLHGIYDRSVSEISGKLLDRGRTEFSELLAAVDVVKVEAYSFESEGVNGKFARSVRTDEEYRALVAESEARIAKA
ncbi:molybdenum cofactor guanylyltransferase [Paenibacillus sp. PAMC21692]|uniref:molybdenum cofactor guanylyltransferase n=1 Tax=Paenibacillus sp. PAMC21692 TaxID=2762320 RepID=UPI0021C4143A|nr:molybdenum cofactor guanylyltransferase [Paenibacillus sp. PAMC21692]